jgi:hypothetical protein
MATARLHIVFPQETVLDITPEPAGLLELLEEQRSEIEHLRALLRDRMEVQAHSPEQAPARVRDQTPKLSAAHKFILATAFALGVVLAGSATLASTNSNAFGHNCYAGACHTNRDSLTLGPGTNPVSQPNHFDVGTSRRPGP